MRKILIFCLMPGTQAGELQRIAGAVKIGWIHTFQLMEMFIRI